jgi:hypothetical protein
MAPLRSIRAHFADAKWYPLADIADTLGEADQATAFHLLTSLAKRLDKTSAIRAILD